MRESTQCALLFLPHRCSDYLLSPSYKDTNRTERSKHFSCISALALWGAARLPLHQRPPSPASSPLSPPCKQEGGVSPWHPNSHPIYSRPAVVLDSPGPPLSRRFRWLQWMFIFVIIFKKALIQSFIVFSLWLTPLWSLGSGLWWSISEKHSCVDYSHP